MSSTTSTSNRNSGVIEGYREKCLTETELKWLTGKLAMYDLAPACGVENMKKFTSGKQLWNYDNLEPSEKKLVL